MLTPPATPARIVHPVLIAGAWRDSVAAEAFAAVNPQTRERLADLYPVCEWSDLDAALAAAHEAAGEMRAMPDAGERIAAFLDRYAANIESRAEALVAAAHEETALPVAPRLRDVELPRTTNQLRQAATAARDGSWRRPTIDTKANIRSILAPIGPVLVIGPNNFPFAFNAISGGDFAAAIAAGNPVIAKAHPLHPTTSRLLAEAAHEAARGAGLPGGAVQMVYHMESVDGLKCVSDHRLKAVAFTGSRAGGMRLKRAADEAGTLFFGEMSSVNPVVMLPGALAAKCDEVAGQLAASILLGCGQFCTKPGLVLLTAGTASERLIENVGARLRAAPMGTLFSEEGASSLRAAIATLREAGAQAVAGGEAGPEGHGVQNTLLRVAADCFLADSRTFQTECFGSACLIVTAATLDELVQVIGTLDGNLTGSIYYEAFGEDNDVAAYDRIAPVLRPRVGRLLNNKMPTGVTVSGAMQHGGPFPATTQPHFTAVGMPGAIWRFTQLESYDNVRDDRLPPALRDANPTGKLWRNIDGAWTTRNL